MALPVRWTEFAIDDYKQVIDYLLMEWSISVATEFVKIVESRIQTLSIFPEIGISSVNDPDVRSIVLTKHNKLYYKTSNNQLEILNIFDTRQNPARNKYE